MTSSVSFLIYNLAKYPDVQEKVRQEINENIDPDKELTVRVLNELKYTDMVIRETLRLFPAAPAVARITPEDIKISMKDKSYVFVSRMTERINYRWSYISCWHNVRCEFI